MYNIVLDIKQYINYKKIAMYINYRDIVKSVRESKAESYDEVVYECSPRNFIGACLDIYNENPDRYYKFIEGYVMNNELWGENNIQGAVRTGDIKVFKFLLDNEDRIRTSDYRDNPGILEEKLIPYILNVMEYSDCKSSYEEILVYALEKYPKYMEKERKKLKYLKSILNN